MNAKNEIDRESSSICSNSEVCGTFRSHMPITQRFAYFDHAAVSPLPDSAAARVRAFADQATYDGDTVWHEWSNCAEQLRNKCTQLLNCQIEEIALVSSTTQGINLIAEGFPWKPGENVVVPENEFPSNIVPWRNLARRGVELRIVPVDPSGDIDLSELEKGIDSKTRIVAISWVGFLSGYRIAVDEITSIAHRRGALVLVDAIQGLGAFPIDVKASAVDFLAADGHKWMLGPEGAGVLYIDQKHLGMLEPIMVGWNSLEDSFKFNPASVALKCSAARYEGGSTNMVGMMALEASLGLLLSCGTNRLDSPIASTIAENVQIIHDKLSRLGFETHLPPLEHLSGIMGISWPGANYAAARAHCLSQGVVLSVRGGRLRVSTHGYNDSYDIERLVSALAEYRKHS